MSKSPVELVLDVDAAAIARFAARAEASVVQLGVAYERMARRLLLARLTWALRRRLEQLPRD